MVFASVAEFSAVETKDCDSKNELQKAEGQVGDNQGQGLAGGDSGGWSLVEARECHCEGGLMCQEKTWRCDGIFLFNPAIRLSEIEEEFLSTEMESRMQRRREMADDQRSRALF